MTEEIIASLRSLDLSDGGSHSRLSAIASCFLEPGFGWTRGACETLRDMLIETLEDADGNDDNDYAHDCSCTNHSCDKHGRQVSYDELDNERQKAIAELREIQTDAGGFVKALAGAIGVEWRAPRVAQTIATIRDRLVHLLGGDEPNFTEIAKTINLGDKSDGELMENGENHKIASITDELRKFKGHINAGLAPEMVLALRAEVNCIADRIDEQFDRICEQQEKVLQATIDEMTEFREHDAEYALAERKKLTHDVEMWRDRAEDMRMERDDACAERDNLLDLLRGARDEYKMLDRMSTETSANFHAMRDRVWGLEAERDELQSTIDEMAAELDSARAKNRRLTWHIDQMQGGSKKWREQFETMKVERDELRRSLRQIAERAGVPHDSDFDEYSDETVIGATLAQIDSTHGYVGALEWQRDRQKKMLDDYDKTHAELPKDANGEYIHIGDRVEDNERVVRIVLTDGSWEPSVYIEKLPNVLHEYFCNDIGHYHEPTVEQVIRDLTLGKITESQAIERIGSING